MISSLEKLRSFWLSLWKLPKSKLIIVALLLSMFQPQWTLSAQNNKTWEEIHTLISPPSFGVKELRLILKWESVLVEKDMPTFEARVSSPDFMQDLLTQAWRYWAHETWKNWAKLVLLDKLMTYIEHDESSTYDALLITYMKKCYPEYVNLSNEDVLQEATNRRAYFSSHFFPTFEKNIEIAKIRELLEKDLEELNQYLKEIQVDVAKNVYWIPLETDFSEQSMWMYAGASLKSLMERHEDGTYSIPGKKEAIWEDASWNMYWFFSEESCAKARRYPEGKVSPCFEDGLFCFNENISLPFWKEPSKVVDEAFLESLKSQLATARRIDHKQWGEETQSVVSMISTKYFEMIEILSLYVWTWVKFYYISFPSLEVLAWLSDIDIWKNRFFLKRWDGRKMSLTPKFDLVWAFIQDAPYTSYENSEWGKFIKNINDASGSNSTSLIHNEKKNQTDSPEHHALLDTYTSIIRKNSTRRTEDDFNEYKEAETDSTLTEITLDHHTWLYQKVSVDWEVAYVADSLTWMPNDFLQIEIKTSSASKFVTREEYQEYKQFFLFVYPRIWTKHEQDHPYDVYATRKQAKQN